ncbi:MAG: hypothetical protein ABII22_03845 [Candidatus Micrarchaeota archaeon]
MEIYLSEEEKKQLEDIKTLLLAKKYKDALLAVQKIEKLLQGPHAAMIFVYKGKALKGLKDDKGAENSLMTAFSVVNMAPESDTYAQLIKAEAAILLGKNAEAKKAYQLVLKGDASNKEAKDWLKILG